MLVLPLCFPSAGFAVSLSNNSAVFADSAPDEKKRARLCLRQTSVAIFGTAISMEKAGCA